MCVGFKAGVENGHHLMNHTNQTALFIVVGSRRENDQVLYPDDDFQIKENAEGVRKPARKNGEFYEYP